MESSGFMTSDEYNEGRKAFNRLTKGKRTSYLRSQDILNAASFMFMNIVACAVASGHDVSDSLGSRYLPAVTAAQELAKRLFEDTSEHGDTVSIDVASGKEPRCVMALQGLFQMQAEGKI